MPLSPQEKRTKLSLVLSQEIKGNLREQTFSLLEDRKYSFLYNAFLAASDCMNLPRTGVFSWFRHGQHSRHQTTEFLTDLHKILSKWRRENSQDLLESEKEDMEKEIQTATLKWLQGNAGRNPSGINNSSRLRFAYDYGLLPKAVTHSKADQHGTQTPLFHATTFRELNNTTRQLLKNKMLEAKSQSVLANSCN